MNLEICCGSSRPGNWPGPVGHSRRMKGQPNSSGTTALSLIWQLTLYTRVRMCNTEINFYLNICNWTSCALVFVPSQWSFLPVSHSKFEGVLYNLPRGWMPGNCRAACFYGIATCALTLSQPSVKERLLYEPYPLTYHGHACSS